ncbi:hypothetical protein [Sulfurimonas autotrophica]|uniref:Uncharacterized protein n=1 Tax=Sulfurimonas autotrophica (strain ATCC BAA-671 / DSM 16294 / JCM 11897 / OK10) TaxID=563040 RepID=E0USA3_SULAO|nr:hypothetical protein [Sulfurimonas autotrophica]ADN10196.1 conserved hypothetical protein [Sulfurimonas autotrophica DSM 16294]
MAEKTDSDRIKEIYKLCKSHFGDVRFVGVKYHNRIGWIAKAQLGDEFENLTADGKTSTDALRKLRNRVKKIIRRYNEV